MDALFFTFRDPTAPIAAAGTAAQNWQPTNLQTRVARMRKSSNTFAYSCWVICSPCNELAEPKDAKFLDDHESTVGLSRTEVGLIGTCAVGVLDLRRLVGDPILIQPQNRQVSRRFRAPEDRHIIYAIACNFLLIVQPLDIHEFSSIPS